MNQNRISRINFFNLHKFICFAILLSFFTTPLLAQRSVKDSLRKVDSIKTAGYDKFRINKSYLLENSSDTVNLDNWLWNDKRNLAEILFELPGYLINYTGYGGRTGISDFRSGYLNSEISLFKDGIQISDFNSYVDIENFSVNEIAKIEEISEISSPLYGYSSNNKIVNIITKDNTLPYLTAQLSYTQDRNDALYGDFYFNFPLSRKVNVIFGLGNNGYEGAYQNSAMSLWRFRTKVNWYPSKSLNIKFDMNYAKLERSLNDGLYNSTSDTLLDPIFARVVSTDLYDKNNNLFLNFNVKYSPASLKTLLTDINISVQNYFREYRFGEKNLLTDTSKVFSNLHNIVYSVDAKQYFFIEKSKSSDINLLIGTNFSYIPGNSSSAYIYKNITTNTVDNFTKEPFSLFSRINAAINNFNFSGGVRGERFESNNNLFAFAEADYYVKLNESDFIKLYSGINYYFDRNIPQYATTFSTANAFPPANFVDSYFINGLLLSYNPVFLELKLYNYLFDGEINFAKAFASSAGFRTRYFNGNFSFETSSLSYLPDYILKSDIYYHNILFDNHLDFRTGINIKYMPKWKPPSYNSGALTFIFSDNNPEIDYFNMDFYVAGRIGKANVAFTFANLFNKLNYTSSIYPFDNRGGLADRKSVV